MGIITLKGLKFYAHHGVYKEEREKGNTFIVDIFIETDTSDSEISDQLEDTVDYMDVFNRIKKEMNTPSNLLENVAFRINKTVSELIDKGEIETIIYKQNPPIGGECEYTSVTLKSKIS